MKEESILKARPFRKFITEAIAIDGSVTPLIIWHVLFFGLFATVVKYLSAYFESNYQFDLDIEANPFEIAGAVLGLLLIFRTNSSYDRWWEGRKLWGGIVNQSRNLAITGLAYGSTDPVWRKEFVQWVSVFPHVARANLRQEGPCERVLALIGPEATEKVAAANHMPNFVIQKIAQLLHEAVKQKEMDHFAFMQADTQRALLIDHIGACERILKTPLPLAFVIKIRSFILLFLTALPFALLHRLQSDWLIPFVTMGVAYPILAVDQIGVELQHPFSKTSLSHLPLDDISNNIEKNLQGLLAQSEDSLAPMNAKVPLD
jgi:putative membrane protein